MEHAHQSALENHVHRPPRLGSHRSLNLRIGGLVLCFQLPPAEQAAAIERMVRDLFAGLDPADRAIAEWWLEQHLPASPTLTSPSCATLAVSS
jgi:hypothetical protein